MQLTHARFLKTSLPFIIASVSSPLISAIDTAVVGQLDNYHYINSVALGSVIFSTIYWLFNFLGLTSSGFASQSLGRDNAEEELYAFLRGNILALIIGIIIVLLQRPIFNTAVSFFNPPEETLFYLQQYFGIIIFTVPAALFYQTAQGWLAGFMKVRLSVAVGLSANISNAVLDVIFVYVFNLGVEGVAAATAISNILAFGLSILAFYKNMPCRMAKISFRRLLYGPAFGKLVNCSGHLAVRTLCMLLMVNTFMSQSAHFGSKILAANSILMQIQYIMGDVFAGFSQAAAIYAGVAVGSKNKNMLLTVLKISAVQALAVGFLQFALYYLWRSRIIALFTGLPDILATVQQYDIFIAFFPVLSALGIVYYGIFNGTLQTTPICISMLLTAASYIAAKLLLVPVLANTGLWLAFLVFYLARTGFLLVFVPSFVKKFPYSA